MVQLCSCSDTEMPHLIERMSFSQKQGEVLYFQVTQMLSLGSRIRQSLSPRFPHIPQEGHLPLWVSVSLRWRHVRPDLRWYLPHSQVPRL